MLELFGKEYYIDIDAISENCNIQNSEEFDDENDEETKPVVQINIFKFEIIKMCVDRLFAEFEGDDDDKIFTKTPTISFNLAFNTLKKLKIIKINEDEDDE